MIETYKPGAEELGFKERLVGDADTMSYNRAWGGALPFPKEKWKGWHEKWLEVPEALRYYRYLYDTESREFVGEIAYHYDEERKFHLCDVIVLAKYRNRGFGTQGLLLLCRDAKENGITTLCDEIAADNPSCGLFLKCGFEIVSRNAETVLVQKKL